MMNRRKRKLLSSALLLSPFCLAAGPAFGEEFQPSARQFEFKRLPDPSVFLTACQPKIEIEDAARPDLIKVKWETACPGAREAYVYGTFYLPSAEEAEARDLLFNEEGEVDDRGVSADGGTEPDIGTACAAATCRDFNAEDFPGAFRVMRVDLPSPSEEAEGSFYTRVYLPRNRFILVVRSEDESFKTAVVQTETGSVSDQVQVPPDIYRSSKAAVRDPKGLQTMPIAPSITLNDGGNHQCSSSGNNATTYPDCNGTLDLLAVVKGTSSTGSYNVSLYANGQLLTSKTVPAAVGDIPVVFQNVVRDHNHTHWVAKIGNVESNPLLLLYSYYFILSNDSWSYSYTCSIDDCDSWGDGDCCDGGPPWNCDWCPSSTVSNCSNHITNGSFNWSGRHIKSITSTCGGSFSNQPSNNNYTVQTGSWSASNPGTGFSCEVKATTYNGVVIIRNFATGSWNDNC